MNPYELLARERKAAKLAAAIRKDLLDYVDPDILLDLKPYAPFWIEAARQAGVPPPSAATCSAVIELLKGKP